MSLGAQQSLINKLQLYQLASTYVASVFDCAVQIRGGIELLLQHMFHQWLTPTCVI